MLFYSLIFFSISLLAFCEEIASLRQKKIVDFMMFAILCIVSAMHGIGGADWEVYLSAYNRCPDIFEYLRDMKYWHDNIFNFEYGYLFIISLIKTLGFNFNAYIVIQNIVFYSLMYVGLKRYTRHWGLVLLIFMYKMFIYDTFVSMRQPITIVGLFLIMKYIYERQGFRYFLCATLLFTVHNGALILFPLYLITYFKLTKKRLITLSILFLPTILIAQSGAFNALNTLMALINQAKGEGYSDSTGTLNIAYTLEYYLLLYFVIKNYNKLIQLKYGEFMIKIFLVVLPIVTLFSNVLILRRELDYFFVVYGIIGGYLCDVLPKMKFVILTCFILISYYGFSRYLYNFAQGGMIPYKTWLQTNTY